MRSVLTTLADELRNNANIQTLMGDNSGGIWDIQQPNDLRGLPTITTLWQESPTVGNKSVRLGVLTVNIWDHEGSTIRCEQIRDEIVYMFDRNIFVTGEKQWIRLFYGTEMQVPSEVDETLVQWVIDFNARYFRQGWIERVLAK